MEELSPVLYYSMWQFNNPLILSWVLVFEKKSSDGIWLIDLKIFYTELPGRTRASGNNVAYIFLFIGLSGISGKEVTGGFVLDLKPRVAAVITQCLPANLFLMAFRYYDHAGDEGTLTGVFTAIHGALKDTIEVRPYTLLRTSYIHR